MLISSRIIISRSGSNPVLKAGLLRIGSTSRSINRCVPKLHQNARYISNHSIPEFKNNEDHLLYYLIALNCAVYLGWYVSDKDYKLYRFLIENFTISTSGLYRYHRYHTTVTSVFSHKDLSHLAVNMFVLFSFGHSALACLGVRGFLPLYLGGGIISSICQASWPYFIPRSWPARFYRDKNTAGLGASGAVNAVVTWNVLTFPRNLIFIYGIIPIPAILFGVGYIGMDAYSLYHGNTNVGNAAHLGGAAFGVAMFLVTRGRLGRTF